MAKEFIGRESELGAIRTILSANVPGAMVVTGPPGVGKSRLVREALARASDDGHPAFWVSGSTATQLVPFGALLGLVPGIAGLNRFHILHRVAGELRDLPGRCPVIAVDDAHCLDGASAALTHHLVSARAAFVLATVRTGEPAPAAITSLWKDEFGDRMDLGAFARPVAMALVESLINGRLDPLASEQLWNLGQGNALYITELVRAGLVTGALWEGAGAWHWSGTLDRTPRLADLVLEHVRSTDEGTGRLLGFLAIGEPLELDSLHNAGFTSQTVMAAENAGLVRTADVRGHITVRLGHPLYGEVLRSQTSALERAGFAAELLAATAGDGPSPAPMRRAIWQLAAGTTPDPVLLLRAATDALAALDLPLARQLASAAVEADGGVDAQILLARTCVLAGDLVRAEALFADLGEKALPVRMLAELAAERAWNLTFGLEDPDKAGQVLSEVWESGRGGRAVVSAQRANLLTYAGRPTEALAALADFERFNPTPTDVLKATSSGCQSLSVSGLPQQAVNAGRRAVRLAVETLGSGWSMGREEAESALAGALMLNAELDAAEEVATTAYDRALAAGWPIGTGMWSLWLGEIAIARGKTATAERFVRAGLAAAVQDSHPYGRWMQRFGWQQLSKVAALQGDAMLAGSAWQSATVHRRPWLAALDVWGGSTAAWLAAAQGSLGRAAELALKDANHARATGLHGWELAALHQVPRFGMTNMGVQRLKVLTGTLDGPFPALFADHLTALTTSNGDLLDNVAGRFCSLGSMLLAAEASAQAANLHLHVGNHPAAKSSEHQAHLALAQCENAATPAVALLSASTVLTPRESEIARMASSGMNNRGIAQALFVSIRTVENTLHHVYEKLDVRDRAELAQSFKPRIPGPGQE